MANGSFGLDEKKVVVKKRLANEKKHRGWCAAKKRLGKG